MIAPRPVTTKAIVPGSGAAPAWALKLNPPGQQLPSTHPNLIEKFAPFGIPLRGLLPLTPESRISTAPLSSVRIVQLKNRLCAQLMASAGTPFSISFSEAQFFPDALVKNSVPFPFSGVLKLRSEEHTSELQSRSDLVCRLLLEK